jgi:hypothetical protein
VGHQLLDMGEVIPHGSSQARFGLAFGQVLGGIVTLLGGVTGEVLGGIATTTGIGAAVGVPTIVVSTTFVVGGFANIAAGLSGLSQAAMSQGSGSGSSTPPPSTPAAGGAALKPYGGPGGGHHVPAKGAFAQAPGYDPNKALAIPNAELTCLGVRHSTVTGAQQTAYRAFAGTGKPLTWEVVSSIETNALIKGGMKPDVAQQTVDRAIGSLKASGVSGPTRIPWGG